MLELKEQGNKLFKEGEYLHAAAAYTKAIKKDPANPVLYRWGKSMDIVQYPHVNAFSSVKNVLGLVSVVAGLYPLPAQACFTPRRG